MYVGLRTLRFMDRRNCRERQDYDWYILRDCRLAVVRIVTFATGFQEGLGLVRFDRVRVNVRI